jgi:hypothetical protein
VEVRLPPRGEGIDHGSGDAGVACGRAHLAGHSDGRGRR